MAASHGCAHDHGYSPDGARHGSRLEHGAAHAEDHRRWSRRDFMLQLGLAASALPFMLGNNEVFALQHTPILRALATSNAPRVLVIIQMGGGNDGLNTIVPVRNDIYYQQRPTLAIPKSAATLLDEDTGLHPQLAPLASLWDAGRMGVVRSAGYTESSRSHFFETQAWLQGSGDGVEDEGWVGRYLTNQYEGQQPAHPPAVRFGGSQQLLQTLGGNFSLSMNLSRLQDMGDEGGLLFNTDGLPENPYGSALRYVRDVANATVRFAEPVRQAYQEGYNNVSYPEFTAGNSTRFSQTFASIARLIRGGLQSKVYVLSGAGGFDTHRNQANSHAQRMEEIGKAVATFYQDLAQDGLDERVLTMTFSEFGRTIHENGSKGTDHGAGAPMMLFGSALNGGFQGAAPDLSEPFNQGATPTTDFRSVYRTILEQWFGLDAEVTQGLVGGAFPVIDDMIAPPPAGDPGPGTSAQTIDLDAGWNLIGSRIQPSQAALSELLSGLGDDLLLVKDPMGRVYMPEQGIEDLQTWEAGTAYQLYLKRASSLTLEGWPLNVTETPLELTEGWNHVAYLPDGALTPADAFTSLGDALVLAKDQQGRVYSSVFGMDELGTLTSGQGYQLYLTREATLQYPEGADGSTAPTHQAAVQHFATASAAPGAQATLVCEVPAMADLSEVQVRSADDRPLGAARVHSGTAVVTIAGYESISQLPGAQAGDSLFLRGWDALRQQEVTLEPSTVQTFDGRTQSALRYQGGALLQAAVAYDVTRPVIFGNYPNPFQQTTTVTYQLPEDAHVTLTVYNALGQRVQTLVDGLHSAGRHEATVEANSWGSGWYACRLRVGDQTETHAMLLTR